MQIEVSITAPEWETIGFGALAARACAATLDHVQIDREAVEISILATNDAEIARLNTEFRGKPVPTNVLSWPAQNLAPDAPGAAPELPQPGFDGLIALGDIAIAHGICAAEAAAGRIPPQVHVTHLLVHGMLHLLGYDHEDDLDAELMQRLEVEILGKLGHDDPYKDKAAADPR